MANKRTTRDDLGEKGEKKGPNIVPSLKAAASRLGIPYIKVKSARAKGCPAFDSGGRVKLDILQEWLDEQEKLKASKKKKTPAPIKIEQVEETHGAGQTLRRLEGDEVKAYQDYMQAKDDGEDDEVINQKHDRWLKVSNSLLQYDSKVTDAKRGAGELIPQEEVIEFMLSFISWIDVATEAFLNTAVPKLHKDMSDRDKAAIVWEPIKNARKQALKLAVKNNKLPGWVTKKVIEA